tara:strand:+ start:689 stop:1033 length:345 start_codon:yes stop_codon:yes gene_type:complete
LPEINVTVYKDNYDGIEWSSKTFTPKPRIDFSSNRSDIEMPYISGDYKPYDCPITGRTIDGKREHNENLQLHGCRIHEKGEFEDVKKNGKKRTEAAMDAAIDKSVDAIAKQIDI